VLTLLLVAALHLAAPAQAPRTPVRISNAADHARAGEPVSFGFPLAETPRATDLALLRVEDASGRAVPSQFRALARWRAPREDSSAPLKWVLATFAPEVPARSVATFHVAYGAAPPPVEGGCVVSSDGASISVRTSRAAAFAVPKRAFAPFGSASIGEPAIELVPTTGALAMFGVDARAIEPVVTSETAVEEPGPLRVVLVQRGALGELRYTCRWTFRAGRADVSLDFRLENPRAYGIFDKTIGDGKVAFDSLALLLPVAGPDHVVTAPAGAHPLPPGESYELSQTWTAGAVGDTLAGFSFTETLGAEKLRAGRRHAGAVDLSGPKGGVTAAVDRFWQTWPKALSAKDGVLRVELFPASGHGPEFRGQYASPGSRDQPIDPLALEHFRFEGGRWRTSRVVFDFHAGPRGAAEVDAVASRLESPLVGGPEPAAVRKSGVLGPFWVERGLLPAEPGLDRFERFLDIMADDHAADPTGNIGRIGLPAFLARGGTFGNRHPYGWDHFGDLPWGDGWCNLHYDWPAALLSGFLRTGDARLFHRGCDMAAFRRDYGQNHSQDPREPWRGAAFYEKGSWHGNYNPGTVSHNWNLGLVLHYAITGEESTREALIENVDYLLLRSPPKRWTGWWGSRIPGWAIDGLVDAYGVLGDPRCLEEAGKGVARFAELEMQDGAEGYHLNPSNKATQPWMDNIFFVAAAKYVAASGDPSPLPLLARMRNWFKRSCIVPPYGSPASMTLPHVYEGWSPVKADRPMIHHLWSMSDSLSTSAVLFDDADDRMWATILFEAAVRFWQEPSGSKAKNPLNASGWSPITMRPLSFPNSESKVLSNVLRYGVSHLAMRAHAAGVW
jgi:hypothetical protein